MKRHNGTVFFERQPSIAAFASVVGKKEGEGPLRDHFDRIIHDSYAGKDTFEKAESELMNTAVRIALNKGALSAKEIDAAYCGDLLNQCVASSFALRPYGIPYAGVYGACSTMALSMITAATAIESGAAEHTLCAASSHYCTAERQYRFPLEYGSQRPPTAQWTVTGAGACILSAGTPENSFSLSDSAEILESVPASNSPRTSGNTAASESGPASDCSPEFSDTAAPDSTPPLHGPSISAGTAVTIAEKPQIDAFHPYLASARLGKIVDYGITDQNNMGAAMAPAVVKLGTIHYTIETA